MFYHPNSYRMWDTRMYYYNGVHYLYGLYTKEDVSSLLQTLESKPVSHNIWYMISQKFWKLQLHCVFVHNLIIFFCNELQFHCWSGKRTDEST